MSWIWGKKKGPFGGGSPITQFIDKSIFKHLNPEPSKQELQQKLAADQAVKAALEAVKAQEMPDENNPNVLEAARAGRRAARKRKGVSSTILSGGQLGDDGYDSGTVLG